MPFTIVRNDITKVQADAIVNAANNRLLMGGGVCGAIFKAAGIAAMQKVCDKIGWCDTGKAVMTEGFSLPASYVIHTAGPVWRGGKNGEEQQLRGCYQSCLKLAVRNHLESIAFPLISSGIYGYPKEEALSVALSEFRSFLLENDMRIYLVVFDRTAVRMGERLTASLEQYIDDNYAAEHDDASRRQALLRRNSPASDLDDFRTLKEAVPHEAEEYSEESGLPEESIIAEDSVWMEEESAPPRSVRKYRPVKEQPGTASPRSLEDIVNHAEETFSQMLLRLIDEKGITDVQAYKRANIDRKLFSKIRSNPDYAPSKRTALALAVSLELSLDETRDLLLRAGYALSHSSRFDLIVEYFIGNGSYDIFTINEALFAFGQQTM